MLTHAFSGILLCSRLLRKCCASTLLFFLAGLAELSVAQSLATPEPITSQQGLPQAFVPSIVQDWQGFIWAATRDGLCRYDGHRFKVFQPEADGRPSLSFAGVNRLTLDHHGRIWVTSELGHIDIFDPRTETFINFSRQSLFRNAMKNRQIMLFCIDYQDRLWVVPNNASGILQIDLKRGKVSEFRHQPGQSTSLRNDTIYDVAEGVRGQIWVATRAGINCFEPRTGQFQSYPLPTANAQGFYRLYACPNDELLLLTQQELIHFQPRTGITQRYALPIKNPDLTHTNLTADSQGRVYFNTGYALLRFSNQAGIQLMARHSPDLPREWGTRLWVDRSDVLWEGTGGAGIRKYDLRAMPFRTSPYQESFHGDLLSQPWLDLPAAQWIPTNRLNSYDFRYTIDGRGKLWYNAGSSRICQIDLKTKQLVEKPLPEAFANKAFGDPPCPLATDPVGQVWAVRDSLVWYYQEQQARWKAWPYHIPTQQTGLPLLFTIDKQALWIATDQRGLWRLDRNTGQVRQYANNPHQLNSLSNNALFSLSDDPKDANRLWIGTFGSGLCAFDKRTGLVRRFTEQDGLPNNVIYSVIPDQHGYLWMGTNKGICQMNRQTFATHNYTHDDGLLADEFNRFHWLHLPDDQIIMGGLEGITAFYPGQLRPDTYQPAVELTSLLVNNRPFPAPRQRGKEAESQPIQALHELTLPYDQNYVTADFAVMQFNRTNRNRFRYQLQGLDHQWTETDRSVAVYTALPPGHYVLWLNASNTSGQWSRYIRKLAIVITPPIWATWWAYILYGLACVALSIVILRAYANRLRLRQSVVLKQQEAQQLRANDELKNRFLANISHEFRTPLSLILAPTEQMMGEVPTPRNQRRLLTIEQNAHQLLRLINQLLDLAKLEAGVMPIHEVQGGLSECIAQWLEPLSEQATAQGLTLSFRSEVTGMYYFDAEKLERIVYNLAANALKFTKEGTITVSLTAQATHVTLTVADTGIGISTQNLPHIFDRFYQVGPGAVPGSRQDAGPDMYTGTGIGLALVKELVELQGGRIAVSSTLHAGTTFVVELPYWQATDAAPAIHAAFPTETVMDAWDSPDEPEAARVLLVEDNDDLARFIAESLPDHYRVRRAVNGRDGLEQALEHQPDLVISDVLMPEMDGFTLCGHLKTDLRTSHIPVILLTAKAATESRLEGLRQGADDYVTKPFQVRELQLRVHNQLTSKRSQRDWVRASLTNPTADPTQSVQPPDPFLTQLYALIEAHLDNTTFGVDRMITELGLSRTSLFRKVKSLTDLSPNELIRNYRLKRAAQLLRDGHAITQTAYEVGFDSPAYFSKCFRDLYQLTPREFVAQA